MGHEDTGTLVGPVNLRGLAVMTKIVGFLVAAKKKKYKTKQTQELEIAVQMEPSQLPVVLLSVGALNLKASCSFRRMSQLDSATMRRTIFCQGQLS